MNPMATARGLRRRNAPSGSRCGALKTNKYNAVQTIGDDGQPYDSRLEADCARVLDLLKKQGRIHTYARQVPFLLAPKRGRERAVRYFADFAVTTASGGGRAFIIESRGYEPAGSRLKRRWFMEKYQHIPLHVVRAPEEVIAVLEEREQAADA